MTQPIDQSPVVPSKVVVRFPGRRCSGAVPGTVPDYYVKTITTSAAGVTAAGFPSTKTFHEYALALFTVGGGTPTNQTALDALALRTTKDYYNWLGRSFDRLYSGVLNVRSQRVLLKKCSATSLRCARFQSTSSLVGAS